MIHGVGVNDADYAVQPRVNGKRVICPFYRAWASMLERCYSKKFKERCPTYVGCKVCPEWKYFMTFRAWMIEQEWEGMQLDKDLLGDKLYSPETCCFVEPWLNTLFIDCGRARGKWPIGVSLHMKKFQALLRINGTQKYLGTFNTPQEAHTAYKAAKLKYVRELMEDYPDERIKHAVIGRVLCPTK